MNLDRCDTRSEHEWTANIPQLHSKDLLVHSFVLCTWYFLNVSFHHRILVKYIDEYFDKNNFRFITFSYFYMLQYITWLIYGKIEIHSSIILHKLLVKVRYMHDRNGGLWLRLYCLDIKWDVRQSTSPFIEIVVCFIICTYCILLNSLDVHWQQQYKQNMQQFQ
jgi:hypothetical protein